MNYEQEESEAEAERIFLELLPLWTEHVRMSRSQTEEAITALTQRFSNLVDRLQAAMEASRQVSGVAGEGERSMDGVVATMRKALDENQEVVQQVAGLSVMARELEGMVEVVKDVARQTDLIALNASIEAARAGEAGKSFAVVAAEVRRLSQESRKAGQLIGEKIQAIGATVVASAEKIRYSAATIEGALLGMSGMSQASVILQRESVGIQREISDMLVSLQFQDRVCQILNTVTGHMDELQQLLSERAEMSAEERGPLSLEECVGSLRSRYTMEEQHQLHGEDGEDEAGADEGDVTFF